MNPKLRSIILVLLSMVAAGVQAQDFSNKGTDFWVIYTGHIDSTKSRMALYITSDQNASGTVSVAGHSEKFTVLANQVTTVRLSQGSTLLNSLAYNGQSAGIGTNRGIHIVTDHPVVVYAHILNSARSGSTLVLPTNTLGREYYVASYASVSPRGNAMRRSQFAVVATEDHTAVEITPTLPDIGHIYAANSTFQVVLNRGDVFQYQSANDQDLTGSHIRSVGVAGQPCKPIGVFSGSTWTALGCNNGTSGDNLYQQLFPFASWGKLYYTAPFYKRAFDIFRILVQDPTTIVKVNGTPLNASTLVGGRYYEVNTTGNNSARIIEADKPVCVLQYMVTQDCDGVNSDPEMIILNSVEQTLNDITVMSARRDLTPPNTNISSHYLNIIFKTGTFASLRIDGSAPKANPVAIGGTGFSYLQEDVTASTKNNPAHRITSDSGFICIAYGYGNVESYGYNAGTNVKDLYQFVTIKNEHASVDYPATCRDAPFYFSMTFPYQPTQIKWQFNGLFGDETINAPVYDSTWSVNGRQLYRYRLPGKYSTASTGNFPIKVVAQNPTADGCSGEQEIDYTLQVLERPQADFAVTGKECLSDTLYFSDKADSKGRPVTAWLWDFDDGLAAAEKNPAHEFSAAGSYAVKFSIATDIGCLSDTAAKTIAINALPTADFSVTGPACAGQNTSFADASTSASGAITKWSWDLGDGSVLTKDIAEPLEHKYNQTGSYTIQLITETDKGCADTMSKEVKVSATPLAGFIAPENCVSDPFLQFLDTSSVSDGMALVWLWNFGDPNAGAGNANTSDQQNPTHKYKDAGDYDVSLSVASAAGCEATVTQRVTVNGGLPQSVFTIDGGLEKCSSEEVSVTNNSNVDVGTLVKLEIYWDYGNDPTNKTVVEDPVAGASYRYSYPSFSSPQTKDYEVRVVAYSGENCLSSSSQTLTLKASPQIVFSALDRVCASEPAFQISAADGNGVSGSGVFTGAGVTAAGLFDPAAAGAGTHTIRYSFTAANGCSSFSEQNIEVLPVPAVSAGPDQFILEGGSGVLSGSASGNNLQYLWSPSIGLSDAKLLQPTVHPANDMVYTLTATSADGCMASDEVRVTLLKTPVIPNTFSPNGDGVHDMWEIQALQSYPDCRVQVFNRYGQLVFQSKGYSLAWDGSFNGKPLPAGTYYYIIDPKNGRTPMKGFVDIIR